MNRIHLKMIGHGSIILIIGLLAGFGLVMSLVGGFEIIPTKILEFEMPGDPKSWARAHTGGIMNGMLVLLMALVAYLMKLPSTTTKKIFWMVVGAGYANTLFYYGGIMAGGHRALTVGDNRLGETNLAGVLGYLPALTFAIILIIASWIIMKHAFRIAKDN